MKSNVCLIEKGGAGLSAILSEVEKAASYNGLDHKQTLRLTLLAEELTGMLPELLRNFSGKFWIESNGAVYELHVEVQADGMDRETKDNLISVSRSKKNAAACGIMGKIREAAENMILRANSAGASDALMGYRSSTGAGMESPYVYVWSLDQYKAQVQEERQSEEWDALERSIVAKLADDVIVGVRGKHVDIVIKKTFSK